MTVPHSFGAPDLLDHLEIGVLYGGPSSEREVSLRSGEAVAAALAAAGRKIHRVIIDGSFNAEIARSLDIDVAFLALHGEFGEDGRVQMILEEAGIPYIGSGPDASSRAFDKVLAKRSFEANGILTPAWMAMEKEEFDRGGEEYMGLTPPLVIKPAEAGSSLGVTIVKDSSQVHEALKKSFEFCDCALIERYVAGRELTVAILGEEALPVVELKAQGEFFDYRAKYQDPATGKQCPADLPREISDAVQATALAAHRALGCVDVSRTDIMLDAQGLAWVLEVNTLPGLTQASLYPKAAAAAGIDFVLMCEFLLRKAVERGRRTAAA